MSFFVDGSVDLLGRASRIVGQGVALQPPENGSGATRASGSARSFVGRDQAGDRLARLAIITSSPAWADLISCDSRFLASKMLTCRALFSDYF
jgi:hypothetical protein